MKFQFLKINVVLLLTFLSFSVFSQDTTNLRYFMQNGSQPLSAISYGNNSAAGHYVKSGDVRIYYEVYGKGKPIVVLHGGIVGSILEMGRFIDSLSRDYKVIAISTRGHGKSEMGWAVPSYDQKAKDVNAVVQS